MSRLKALLAGDAIELMMALPSFLSRAGFDVHVITNNQLLLGNKFIKKNEWAVNLQDIVIKLSQRNLDDYDFIILCNDEMIEVVLNSDLALEKKLKLLPVNSEKNFSHLFSKIGLSQILSAANIATPEFLVVENFSQAVEGASKIGYPLMVKLDSANGGLGVFECKNFSDLAAIKREIFNSPLVIQKKSMVLSLIYRQFIAKEI